MVGLDEAGDMTLGLIRKRAPRARTMCAKPPAAGAAWSKLIFESSPRATKRLSSNDWNLEEATLRCLLRLDSNDVLRIALLSSRIGKYLIFCLIRFFQDSRI